MGVFMFLSKPAGTKFDFVTQRRVMGPGRGHMSSGELGLEPRVFGSKGRRVTNYTTPQYI